MIQEKMGLDPQGGLESIGDKTRKKFGNHDGLFPKMYQEGLYCVQGLGY